jgi:hypothetical protein
LPISRWKLTPYWCVRGELSSGSTTVSVFTLKAGGVRNCCGVRSVAVRTGRPLRRSALFAPPKMGSVARTDTLRVSPGALWKMNDEKTNVLVRS